MKRGSVGRSQAVLMGSHLLRLGLGLATTITIGRRFVPEDFGLFAFVAAIFLFGRFFLDLGSGQLAAREISKNPQDEAGLIGGLVTLRALLALCASLGILLLALLETGAPRRVLAITACAFPLLAYGGYAIPFQLRQRPVGPALFGIGTQILVLLGVLFLPALGVADAELALLLVLREVLDVLALRWMSGRFLGMVAPLGIRGRGLRRFLAQALRLGGASVLQISYFHLDVFLVRWLRDPVELGGYAASFRAINPLVTIPGLLMSPLLPLLAWSAVRPSRFRPVLRGASAFLLGVGALAAVLGALAAPQVLQLLYGGVYLDGPLSSVVAFRWLSLALGAIFATGALGCGLVASGSERELLRLGFLGLGVNLLGNLLLIPLYGIDGAAAMTAVTELSVFGASAWLLRTRCGRFFGPIHLAALAPAALALTLLLVPPPFRLAAATAFGMLSVLLLWNGRPLRRLRRFQERMESRRHALSSRHEAAE